MSFDVKTKRFDTPHALELAYLAALVAVEAPVQANKYASTAKIPWHLIDALREVLAKDGFDWRKAASEAAHIERERRIAEYQRRYPSKGDAA
jgi:hypothetical protein